MTIRLESKSIVEKYRQILTDQIASLKKQGHRAPSLKVILVGNDPASQVYTRHKEKFCQSIGADCKIINLDSTINESDFLSYVEKTVHDDNTDGIIIQLPLPQHLKHLDVSKLIPQQKDVDGFHPLNIDSIVRGLPFDQFLPCCTPKGIITLLDEYQIDVSSKNVIVIGRSMIVGKPISMMLLARDATVTMAHSKTRDLKSLTKNADIIISAVGVPKFLDKEYLRETQDQVLIDVGINRDENGTLCGDMNYDQVAPLVKAITPVPGGVGPLTVLSLCQNLLQVTQKTLYEK